GQPVAQAQTGGPQPRVYGCPSGAPEILGRPLREVIDAIALGLLTLFGRERTVARVERLPRRAEHERVFTLRPGALKFLRRVLAIPEQIRRKQQDVDPCTGSQPEQMVGGSAVVHEPAELAEHPGAEDRTRWPAHEQAAAEEFALIRHAWRQQHRTGPARPAPAARQSEAR